MTKLLSNLLNAKEPEFSRLILKFESFHGHTSEDIKFSLEIKNKLRQKLAELGLDEHDTSETELYQSLMLKIKQDNKYLTSHLRTLSATKISAEADLMRGIKLAVDELEINKSCFALKNTKLKTLLKSNPPKKSIKILGYRSIDSMLKREDLKLVYLVATLHESNQWHDKFADKLRKTNPTDFEVRQIEVLAPSANRWQNISKELISERGNLVNCLPLVGTIVLLPIKFTDLPDGAAIANLYLTLCGVNDIYVNSSYLEYYQFSKKFSEYVNKSFKNNLEFKIDYFDHSLPWQLIHRLSNFAPLKQLFKADDSLEVLENTNFLDIEKSITRIAPNLNFWTGTSYLAMHNLNLNVSLNMMDNAINLANKLDISNSIKHYLRDSIWQELLLRYFSNESNLSEELVKVNNELGISS